jgi:hypothetical protein
MSTDLVRVLLEYNRGVGKGALLRTVRTVRPPRHGGAVSFARAVKIVLRAPFHVIRFHRVRPN